VSNINIVDEEMLNMVQTQRVQEDSDIELSEAANINVIDDEILNMFQTYKAEEQTDFIEGSSETYSYSLEGDMDALAYELNLIDNNEF
jgi:hypothetical protein